MTSRLSNSPSHPSFFTPAGMARAATFYLAGWAALSDAAEHQQPVNSARVPSTMRTARPAVVSATAVAPSTTLDRSTWKVTAKSSHPNKDPNLVVDGNVNSFYQSLYTPTPQRLPQWLVIDMGQTQSISGFTYLPRQDNSNYGNVAQHTLTASTDGKTWRTLVSGIYANDKLLKQSSFALQSARYVNFTALTEVQNHPGFNAAEINLLSGDRPTLFLPSADSEETAMASNQAIRATDNILTTLWHTRYSGSLPVPGFPHTFCFDMQRQYGVYGLEYVPRQGSNPNGNIGGHQLVVSSDNRTWEEVASGSFQDDARTKTVSFAERSARFVCLRSLSEAGGRGPWSSAAQINLAVSATFTPPSAGLGQWGPTIDFPIVPVSAAMLYDSGKLLVWSSFLPSSYSGSANPAGQTLFSTYNPVDGLVSARVVADTGHDMFCPGLSLDAQGRAIITGGDNANLTTVYDPTRDAFTRGPVMRLARGYQAQAALSNGATFVIGGSWSGGTGGKNGELLAPGGAAWTALPGCPVAPMLTQDSQGVFRADNHAWLFGWNDGSVFQAGPSRAMNWYFTAGSGKTAPAGNRGDSADAMNGNAVMYDALKGLIFTAGGSPNYQSSTATAAAHTIQIGAPGSLPIVKPVASLAYRRAFANSVLLADGKVFIVGGQGYAQPFSDATAVFAPELWDPATGATTKLPLMSSARTYHSVALLMPDATVFVGGGGLCGDCATNHFDGQVYRPPYLFANNQLALRPVIKAVKPASLKVGGNINVTTDGSITRFNFVRLGSNTHSVNTDQRFAALTHRGSAPNYQITLPNQPGALLPGQWWLFGINAAGVPSKAASVRIQIST